jgi:hypothetical protein
MRLASVEMAIGWEFMTSYEFRKQIAPVIRHLQSEYSDELCDICGDPEIMRDVGKGQRFFDSSSGAD